MEKNKIKKKSYFLLVSIDTWKSGSKHQQTHSIRAKNLVGAIRQYNKWNRPSFIEKSRIIIGKEVLKDEKRTRN